MCKRVDRLRKIIDSITEDKVGRNTCTFAELVMFGGEYMFSASNLCGGCKNFVIIGDYYSCYRSTLDNVCIK